MPLSLCHSVLDLYNSVASKWLYASTCTVHRLRTGLPGSGEIIRMEHPGESINLDSSYLCYVLGIHFFQSRNVYKQLNYIN